MHSDGEVDPLTITAQQRISAFLDGSSDAIISLVESLRKEEDGAERVRALELLAALSVSSASGHGRALDFFEQWKNCVGGRYRLEPLVEELRRSLGNPELTKALLAVLNCILIGADSVDHRVRLRNEFLGVKLLPVLDKIREERSESDVVEEVERFDSMRLSDDEQQFSGVEGVLDLNSHLDIFYAILRQVAGSPQETLFLNILQHLVQIDSRDNLSDRIWETIERMVARIRLIDSKEEAEKILRTPVNTPLMDKLRASGGRCQCAAPPIAPPPPPPLPPPLAPPPPPPGPPPPPSFLGANEKAKAAVSIQPISLADMLNSTSKNLQAKEKRKAVKGASPQTTPSLRPSSRPKLKSLPWIKVSASKVEGRGDNLWTKVTKELKSAFDVNYEEIERLFSQKTQDRDTETPSISRECPALTSRRLDTINLLGSKKSLKINVFIKQYKRGVEDVISLIRELKGEELGLEKLKGLVKILPDSEEVEMLSGYSAEESRLGIAETFFLRLIQLPNYGLRMELMLWKEEFASLADYVKPAIDTVILAAQELKDCSELQEVLCLVLMVGNHLNSGGYGGDAAGFKLTSLWKLVEIRANKPGMTLMHFLAIEAEKKNLLHFPAQLKYLAEASKLSVEGIKCDVESLMEKTDRLGGQVDATEDEGISERIQPLFHLAREEMSRTQEDMKTMESLRVELAEFFCEDVRTFSLEECFRVFHTFIQNFQNAAQGNEQRRIQEEKAFTNMKGLQKKQAETPAGRSLSSKYAALCSSRDITLTTYLTEPGREERKRSSSRDLVDLLEGKGKWTTAEASSSWRRNGRARVSEVDRERTQEEKETVRFNVNGGIPSSGNIDKPQEFNPIFARTRLAQKEKARILSQSDLRASPTLTGGGESHNPDEATKKMERERKCQSLYGTSGGDLDAILSTLEEERDRQSKYKPFTRRRKLDERKQTPQERGNDEGRTDIDEVVRHCERTREEIDRMGEEGEWSRTPCRVLNFSFTASLDNGESPEETDATGGDARSTSNDSHTGSLQEKDEGFETQSHSTVCSVDQPLVVQEEDKEVASPSTPQKPRKEPSYLSGTRSSAAKAPLSGKGKRGSGDRKTPAASKTSRMRAAANRPAAKEATNTSSSSENVSPSRTPTANLSSGQKVSVKPTPLFMTSHNTDGKQTRSDKKRMVGAPKKRPEAAAAKTQTKTFERLMSPPKFHVSPGTPKSSPSSSISVRSRGTQASPKPGHKPTSLNKSPTKKAPADHFKMWRP